MLLTPISAMHNAFLSESHKVFKAMTTPQANARKYLIDTTIRSLMSAGIWAKLDCLYVLAAADAQAALVNWRAPGTFNLTLADAPTFTADRGYTGDGSNDSLATGFTPSTAGGLFTLDSAHMGVWVLNNVAADTYAIGCLSGSTPNAYILPRRAAGDVMRMQINDATGANVGSSITTSAGHTVFVRSASNVRTAYKDGSSAGMDSQASTALPTSAIHILRAFSAFSTHQIAVAHIGGSLNSTEVGDLYNALQTYLTTIGAV